MKNKTIIKKIKSKCVICKKNFFKWESKIHSKGARTKGARQWNAICCSKTCSSANRKLWKKDSIKSLKNELSTYKELKDKLQYISVAELWQNLVIENRKLKQKKSEVMKVLDESKLPLNHDTSYPTYALNSAYVDGWNDCLLELKSRIEEFFK